VIFIAMLHLPACPTSGRGGWSSAALRCVRHNAIALDRGNAPLILVENNFGTPVSPRVTTQQRSYISACLQEVLAVVPSARVGVHVRWNDYWATCSLASAYKLSFCRIAVVGASVETRYGDRIVTSFADVGDCLRVNGLGCPRFAVYVDLVPKNCLRLGTSTTNERLTELSRAGFQRFVFSESTSGSRIAQQDLHRTAERAHMMGCQVLAAGSITPADLPQLAGIVDGVIVGGGLYQRSDPKKPLVCDRALERYMSECQKLTPHSERTEDHR
jgi:predicted TIM-barrel enzyme